MRYPRVLVVSNNSFSKTDSNGRTLGNFFIGWPKDRLAQFCVSSDGADFDICENYCCITDREVIRSRMHFKYSQISKLSQTTNKQSIGSRGRDKKTAFRMFCRNVLWHKDVINNKQINEWVDDFNPEIILVMFSDAAFILDIATRLSKKRDIPLMMFTTEGYYFFKENYFRTKTHWDWMWFPIYQKLFKNQVEQTMKRVSYTVYGNSLLQVDYSRRFGGDSTVLYTTSTIERKERNYIENPLKCSYIGNLTFGRPRALLDVAEVMQDIDKSWRIDVYGKALKEDDEKMLSEHPGIVYHGFVGYDEVRTVIDESKILFHAESQDVRWLEGLRYGFSTKIADSISSGACFILYSSSQIACAKYIQETGAGWFAETKEDLKQCLIDIKENSNHRQEVLGRAKAVSQQNHNIEINCKAFSNAIEQAIKIHYKRR